MTFRSLIPFFAALVGLVLGFWSFFSAIAAALDGSSNGSLGWQILFFISVAVVLAAIVVSIVNLVKKRNIVISAATLLMVAAPLVVVLVFVSAISMQGN